MCIFDPTPTKAISDAGDVADEGGAVLLLVVVSGGLSKWDCVSH